MTYERGDSLLLLSALSYILHSVEMQSTQYLEKQILINLSLLVKFTELSQRYIKLWY